MEHEYLRCSQCGKKVSTTFIPDDKFVLRAWIECPECLEKESDELKLSEKATRRNMFKALKMACGIHAFDGKGSLSGIWTPDSIYLPDRNIRQRFKKLLFGRD